jgi:uncharacterized protein (TIGR00299 family) protein
MSHTLFVDPVGGIAGDMVCAALIDLGADLSAVESGLATLPVEGLRVSTSTVQRGVFAATHFLVECTAEQHHHRTWSSIRTMLENTSLPERVRTRSIAVFERIAIAEAAVHGTEVADVHFHEVGAWDSIADIVGVCLALENLQVDRIVANPPPLATGTIQTAHGTMPLPAPATLKLLEGWPVRTGPHGRECTTPTGAGLLAALAEPGPMPTMKILKTGTGAGTRNPDDAPNILRMVLGKESSASSSLNSVEVLEAQVDDLPGEHLPPLINALLGAGAVDAFAIPILMKKGRSGLLVTALTSKEKVDAVIDAMIRHGSTFGVRRYSAERTVLDRWHETVETPHGSIRVKIGALDGEILHTAPEFEDVQARAHESGQPAPTIHAAALHAWFNTQE